MNRKLLNVLLILAMALSLTVTAFAATPEASDIEQSDGVYITIMVADPVIAYEGDEAGMPATKPGKGGKINPNSAHVKKYNDYLEASHTAALKEVGSNPNAKVYDYTYSFNGFAAFLTVEQAAEMTKNPDVLMVIPDSFRYKETDNTPVFLGLTDPAGAWAKGYDGEGVVVGVIDTGIWPEHPSFADDGSYAEPPVTLDDSRPNCEFGNTAQNPNDVAFECNNKLIGARQMLDTYRALIGADPDEYDSARDDDGHGTHTASTAAGNAGVPATLLGVDRGIISGVAPRAHIVAYKGLGNLGGFTSDLAAAIDQAVADGVDVINYSIGGGASLTGADEIAFLFAASADVFVATSAGNSGPGAGTVGGPGTVPWITTVGASTQNRTFQGSALLGDGSEYFGASVTDSTAELPLVDAEDVGNELCDPDLPFSDDITGKIVLCRRGGFARVFKSLSVYNFGGAGTILYNASDTQTQNTDNHWTPAVHINNTDGMAIKDYIDTMGMDATAQINGGVFTEIPAPWMAGFSSRGPDSVAMDLIKPDITAPGVNILAGNSPTPDPGFLPGTLFQSIGGTSMSSPHIAGVFALLKQAHPDWSAAMAKSAIMTTAYQDVMKEDGMTPADPFDFGAGHVNVGGKAIKGSAFEPGLAYDAGLFEYAAFTCGADLGVFTPGSCDFLEAIGVPMEAYNYNVASIGVASVPGSQTVQRTVTSVAKENGWREYSVSVDAPPGYEVTVEPSSFRLKSGQSVTYDVTITNVSSPIGEWAFGSLTWTDETGHYDVYSPIAVRGSLFSAPAEIDDIGEDGAASFDVTFGYTGSYAAAAHGLVPATVTSDNVVQDPDQEFDPDDGYSNLHQFTLSGAAFFRIAMPPEAVDNPDIDLDIFVYDPNGDFATSSTSGGTNELIDISTPMDGTWSVYVHGWQTVEPSADYDMWTWAISATPGGNLTIDSAPTSATIGETGTIDVSWTGATAGEWHLGAVSHTGDVGLMGLTLINVDNR